MVEVSLAPQLTGISDALKEVFVHGDRSFLAVGDQLGETIRAFAQLTGRFNDLHATLSDPRLSDAAVQLTEVGDDLEQLCAALAEEGRMLAQLQDLNRRVRRRITVIRRTSGAISMLSINAQIAASALDLQSEDFASFTLRFKQLAQSTSKAIAASARQCERLGQMLESAHLRHQAFSKEHTQLLPQMARQLQTCVRSLDGQRGRAADVSRTIGARSRAISDEIGSVVMALQISDITRQRVEHVAEALELVAEGLDDDSGAFVAAASGAYSGSGDPSAADGCSWSAELNEEQRLAVAHHVCQLQEAQMVHALDEFDQEVGRVAAALRRLAGEAEDLIVLAARGYGGEDQGMGSFLDALQAELSRTVGLVREYQHQRSQVDADISAAVATLRGLLEQLTAVDVIEADMRLVSWNTGLLCQRIGIEGRVLGAVARELSSRAAHLREDIGGLLTVVEDIAGAAGRFEQDRASTTAIRMTTMEHTIETSLQPLRQGGADLTAALAQLRPEGAAVRQILRDSAAALAGFDDIGRAIRAMQGRLANIIEQEPQTDVEPELLRGWMQSFRVPQYSMESERAIHARMDKGNPVERVTKPAGSLPPDVSIDDLLF